MKIVITPDSFKNSIDSIHLCDEIEKAILNILPNSEIIKIPVSDGGEGFIDAINQTINIKLHQLSVTGPDSTSILAKYGVSDNSAFLEMAQTCGLQLIENPDPKETTTYGLGELIQDAISIGINDFVIGIGGSATNDGGAGMAQALGFKFYDRNGTQITRKMNGQLIGKIQRIVAPNLPKLTIQVACDVKNPLLGCYGAVYTYAMQKGANVQELPFLENNLSHLADCWSRDLGKDVVNIPGAGAAGGLGGGLMAFLNAKLVSGAEFLLNVLNFDQQIENADIIITGEGKIDSQTSHGKIISEIMKRANQQNIPIYGICGILEKGFDSDNFDKIVELSEFGDDSFRFPDKYIDKAIRKLFIQ